VQAPSPAATPAAAAPPTPAAAAPPATRETAALEGLADIVLPEKAPPQAPGAWTYVFIALAVVGAVLAISAFWRRRGPGRYRREALAELDRLVARLEEKGGRYEVAARLPVLLKRVALTVAPREEVAALTGKEWLAFLDRLYGGDGFTKGPGRLLPRLAYGTPAYLSGVPRAEIDALLRLTRDWIVKHRPPVPAPPPAPAPAPAAGTGEAPRRAEGAASP
jgi:hypothetical protein